MNGNSPMRESGLKKQRMVFLLIYFLSRFKLINFRISKNNCFIFSIDFDVLDNLWMALYSMRYDSLFLVKNANM
jgi:hypothetical protein